VVHAATIVFLKDLTFVAQVNVRVQQVLVVVVHVRMIVLLWDCVVQEHVLISRMNKLVDRATINAQVDKYAIQTLLIVMIHHQTSVVMLLSQQVSMKDL